MPKRSIVAPELIERRYWDDDDDYLSVGDKPWYCFWNSTISEFWIFLDQNMDGTNQTNSTSTITSASSTATTAAPYGLSLPMGPYGSQTTSHTPSMTTSNPSEPTNGPYWTGGSKVKRQLQTSVGSPAFPKLAKMVEKRKPDDNVQPYCQQMQVLNNWQILPIPNVPTICVEESDYTTATATGGNKMARHKRSGNTVQQLGSNCICEWFSD